MGASLSEAKFCPKRKTFQCGWHGYKFCTSDLSLHENPNEKVWQKAFLSPVDQEKYKTPKYKLNQIPFKIENEFIHLLNLKKVRSIEYSFEERFPSSLKAHPLRKNWSILERELEFYHKCNEINERWAAI